MTIENVFIFAERVNHQLDRFIATHLASYFPSQNLSVLPFFARNMPQFAKNIILAAFALVFLVIIKLAFPDKKWINLFIYSLLTVAGLSMLGIYLGLMQLLYS